METLNKIPFPHFRLILFNFQLSFPIRLEAVHIINSSWLFDTAWTMMKSLVPAFVKDRIFFHIDDMDSLHSHIEPKYLPTRYGGIHPDYSMDVWIDNIILKNKRAFDEFLRLGYDISVLLDNTNKTKEKEQDNRIIETTKV